MDIEGISYKNMLGKRPLNVQAIYGDEKVGIVSGRDIVQAFKDLGGIILAVNARCPLSIKGVLRAAKKLDAAVYIELAKSEATYCYGTFENIPEYAVKYSRELGHGIIFGLHVDHYAIKSEKDLLSSITHLRKIVEHGWTSVAVDASHVPDWENLCYTRDVAMNIPPYLGLEVEVGEIKGPGELSSVEEALFFVGGLNAWNIYPDLLAISNGSLHGTYDISSGQHEGIDLRRTKEIADAISRYGVSIAQHGISGTAVEKVSRFADFGIRKGNVATLFQNIIYGVKMNPETGNAVIENGSYIKDPDRGISEELWHKLVSWCDAQGYSRKDGNYKKANLPMGESIMNEDENVQGRIVEETEWWTERFIKAFRAEGSAEKVLEVINRRYDHNAAPERKVLHMRSEFTADIASSGRKGEGNYSD